MKPFAALYRELDATTSSLAKQAALQRYLQNADPSSAAWAVYFLAGGKPRQLVPVKLLRQLAQQAAGLPPWLFDETYEAVGDLAETISLLLPAPDQTHAMGLCEWMEQHLMPLRGMPPDQLADTLRAQWRRLAIDERLVYFKLITGGFRVGVSRLQVTQALAAIAALDPKRVAQRLMGYTHITRQPSAADYHALIAPESAGELEAQTGGQPYPFFLAHPFNLPLAQFDEALGTPSQWLVEWKWDGIRAQLVKRAGKVWLWSRGEELVTERFPELAQMGQALPDGTVLDGEIVVWRAGRVQPFAELQKRIGRKTLGPKLLRELPVALVAYDLLELQGRDLRALAQCERRAALDALLAGVPHPALIASPALQGHSWGDLAQQREAARAMGVEGLMLKQHQAHYGVGRTKDVGVWWKWKIDALSVDAVLIYAQRGHGRRASLYSDYTFAVRDQTTGALLTIGKAYSGLTDKEIAELTPWFLERVRQVKGRLHEVEPELVIEVAFDSIQPSTRHPSGLALRFPRIKTLRRDKTVAEIDTLQSARKLVVLSAD
jgi:DNA ligase-1